MTPRPALRRLLAAVVAVALGALVLASGDQVGAQDVEDLRARADRLAAQLDKLQMRASELDEDYNATTQELAGMQAELGRNRQAVEEARSRMESARQQASSYAVTAFMGAGAGAEVGLTGGDPNRSVNQKVLLEAARGNRQQLVEDLAAARSDLDARSSELKDSTAELEAKKAEQAEIRQELERSVAEQERLVAGANQELKAAIQAEQERRAAEAAAKAKAEAEARQRAAAQQAAARATSTTAPRRSGQSAAGSGSGSGRGAAAPAPAPSPAPVFNPAPVPAPSGGASAAIAAAQSVLGVPYRWAGASPSSGFDCSGLTMWAWARGGRSLPHSSRAQYSATQRVPLSALQPGDLVFYGSPIHHVGLYIGGGQMIHAPHSGDVVKVAPIYRGFGSPIGAGRP